jgi:hypothetical protein
VDVALNPPLQFGAFHLFWQTPNQGVIKTAPTEDDTAFTGEWKLAKWMRRHPLTKPPNGC